MRLAAWLMLSESGAHEAIAERAIERFGWRPRLQSAKARISQWVSPTDPHQLPLAFADDWIEITVQHGASDRITPLLHRAAMRGEDAREPERKRVHKVEASGKQGRARTA